MARKTDPFPKTSPVEVRWLDSMGTHGWQNDTSDSRMEMVSVGHMIRRTKDRVVLSLNKSHYQHGEIMEIPLVSVKRIRRLK